METSILDSLNALSAQASAAMPKPVPLLQVRNYDLADYTYEVIMKQIKAFEDDLDENHEVALKLTSFGQSLTLNVTDVGYANPNTLIFYGYVGDQFATLVQHKSQLNFLLLAVPKADPEKPPRRIGFAPPSEDPPDRA